MLKAFHTLFIGKSTFAYLLLAVSLLLATGQSLVAQSDTLMSEARSLWQKGDKTDAIEKLKSAIEADPSKPAVHMELAGWYMQLGQSDNARLTVDAAIKAETRPKAFNRLFVSAIDRANVHEFAALLQLLPDEDLDNWLVYVVRQPNKIPVEMARLLIDRGARIDQPSTYKTVLMHAASEGHTEIVKLLLARGAQVNTVTDEGNALMQAVRGGHKQIVRLLLDAGAEINTKNRLGNTALINSAGPSIPEMNPPPNAPPPIPDSEIMELLLSRGADPNIVGHGNRTALMEANSAVKVNLLLAHNAEVNLKDEEEQTALMLAVIRGQDDVVEALLKGGADPGVKDATGATALMYALAPGQTYSSAENQKLEKRRLAAARALLLANTGDINAQNEDGETLLMRAVKLGNTELVKLLLARGADVNKSDVLDNTAYVFAYEGDQSEIEQLLRESTRQTPQVITALLRVAIEKKDEPRVRELLSAGADANHEFAIGYSHRDIKTTALIIAAKVGNPAIVRMLLNSGADINAKGLLYGSESGLKYGTALEAAEDSQNNEVIILLKGAMSTGK